jgi:sulfur relay (sulfurtransferase) DsrF/TusC family protein
MKFDDHLNIIPEEKTPTPEEILKKIIPNGCINLKSYNQEKEFIIKAMEEYRALSIREAIEEIERIQNVEVNKQDEVLVKFDEVIEIIKSKM